VPGLFPVWVVPRKSQISTFNRPTCAALYHLIRIEAPVTIVTSEREITCLKCGAPLTAVTGALSSNTSLSNEVGIGAGGACSHPIVAANVHLTLRPFLYNAAPLADCVAPVRPVLECRIKHGAQAPHR